jgi:DNA invertase Pin-like site-specific DNA recombinase
MKVGYARPTTLEQTAGFEAQVRDLTATDCEKVFKEQVSSVGGRQQLAAALDFVRSGDTLAVTKLDRLARSIGHLSEITKALESEIINLTGILYGTELVLGPLLKSAIC